MVIGALCILFGMRRVCFVNCCTVAKLMPFCPPVYTRVVIARLSPGVMIEA